MQHIYLKFYLTEKQHHQGKLLHEWMLEKAFAIGVRGGSVFRAMSGFGRHGHLHEETFFELGGELPVQVEFVLTQALADAYIKALGEENLILPYITYAVEFGVTGD